MASIEEAVCGCAMLISKTVLYQIASRTVASTLTGIDITKKQR
jgi:hypothetical protein